MNIDRLFKLLQGIQKSGVFTVMLISYDPYFFEKNLSNLRTFKDYNFLYEVVGELNKDDVKELVRKNYKTENKKLE